MTTKTDRIEELVSASMDGALSAQEQAELTRAIDADPALAARVDALRQRFGAVDAELRQLAATGAEGEDWGASFADLQARLGDAANAEPTPIGGGASAPVVSLEAHRRTPAWLPAAFAAAAALVLYFAWPGSDATPPSSPAATGPGSAQIAESAGAATDASGELQAEEEERIYATGYGYDPIDSIMAPGMTFEDLEIIEQLDVLDYLAAQSQSGNS